jgi:hypothetical protein
VQVIDIDNELLRRSSHAQIHAGEQATIHWKSECQEDARVVLDTLVPHGPYAYSPAWKIMSAGADYATMKLPIDTTIEEIEAGYIELKKHRLLVSHEPLLEVRGAWYAFHEGFSRFLNKDTGSVEEGVGVLLFPSSGEKGITGELLCGPRRGLPAANTDEERLELRRTILRHHEEYLQALGNADISGILKTFTPDAQSAIRDYVNDTGTAVVLDGEQEHRAFYEALFDKYEVRSVDLLTRSTQHWYLFAEIRMTVSNGDGVIGFNTAEIFLPGPEGRFIDRIGHGTDLAVVTAA